MRGYFEIGIFNGKYENNIGTLWRSAYQLGASGIFTIDMRYKEQSSDTLNTWKHIPLRNYISIDQFLESKPYNCALIGIEMEGEPLSSFNHPQRALYLLGSEDNGIPLVLQKHCDSIISLDSVRTNSYNVAVAGSLVMYNRIFV